MNFLAEASDHKAIELTFRRVFYVINEKTSVFAVLKSILTFDAEVTAVT